MGTRKALKIFFVGKMMLSGIEKFSYLFPPCWDLYGLRALPAAGPVEERDAGVAKVRVLEREDLEHSTEV